MDEAEVLAKTFTDPKTVLLVVTSPFHTRRAKTVLHDAMPDTRIVMVSTPYEEFPEKWWTDFRSARNVVLETVKTLFYWRAGPTAHTTLPRRPLPSRLPQTDQPQPLSLPRLQRRARSARVRFAWLSAASRLQFAENGSQGLGLAGDHRAVVRAPYPAMASNTSMIRTSSGGPART